MLNNQFFLQFWRQQETNSTDSKYDRINCTDIEKHFMVHHHPYISSVWPGLGVLWGMARSMGGTVHHLRCHILDWNHRDY